MARRSDHTRDELFELAVSAAQRIVADRGFKALTARSVAAEIGYSAGTLYNLFDNLDGLVLSVNARTLDNLFDVLSKVPAGNNATESIIALASAYIDFIEKHDNHWNMLFEHHLAPGTKLSEAYLAKIDRLLEVLEGILDAAFPDLEKAEIRQSARVLWASLHGMCSLARAGKLGLVTTDSLPGLTGILVDNFLIGLQSKGPGPTSDS